MGQSQIHITLHSWCAMLSGVYSWIKNLCFLPLEIELSSQKCYRSMYGPQTEISNFLPKLTENGLNLGHPSL